MSPPCPQQIFILDVEGRGMCGDFAFMSSVGGFPWFIDHVGIKPLHPCTDVGQGESAVRTAMAGLVFDLTQVRINPT